MAAQGQEQGTGPVCEQHSDRPATQQCSGCQAFLCNDCVRPEISGTTVLPHCPRCGKVCEPAVRSEAAPGQSLSQAMLSAFAYPLRGRGLGILALGTPVLSLVLSLDRIALHADLSSRFVAPGLAGIVAAYLAIYLFDVMGDSADGKPEPPDWPDLSNPYGDFCEPLLLIVWTVGVCFLPVIAWLVIDLLWTPLGAVPWVLWLLSVMYMPMALLAAALWHAAGAVSPHVVLPAIVRFGPAYLIVCLFFGISVFLQVRVTGLLLEAGFFGHLLLFGATLYLLMVEMRILGLIYHYKKHRLQWFD